MSTSTTDKKFALILNDSLPCGVAMNTAAHLAAQFGTLAAEVGGQPVHDQSGLAHSGIPIYPNVILGASVNELRTRLEAARALGSELLLLDYPMEGFTTSTDDDYRNQLAQKPESELVYYGILLYGEKKTVNKATRGLKLWACSPKAE